MPKAKADDLLFVSKSHKDRLDMLSAGASLVARTGYEVGQLRQKAALDRIKLAVAFYRDAVALQAAPGYFEAFSDQPRLLRDVSRCKICYLH